MRTWERVSAILAPGGTLTVTGTQTGWLDLSILPDGIDINNKTVVDLSGMVMALSVDTSTGIDCNLKSFMDITYPDDYDALHTTVHAIRCRNCTSLTLRNMRVPNARGQGIHLSGDNHGTWDIHHVDYPNHNIGVDAFQHYYYHSMGLLDDALITHTGVVDAQVNFGNGFQTRYQGDETVATELIRVSGTIVVANHYGIYNDRSRTVIEGVAPGLLIRATDKTFSVGILVRGDCTVLDDPDNPGLGGIHGDIAIQDCTNGLLLGPFSSGHATLKASELPPTKFVNCDRDVNDDQAGDDVTWL